MATPRSKATLCTEYYTHDVNRTVISFDKYTAYNTMHYENKILVRITHQAYLVNVFIVMNVSFFLPSFGPYNDLIASLIFALRLASS